MHRMIFTILQFLFLILIKATFGVRYEQHDESNYNSVIHTAQTFYSQYGIKNKTCMDNRVHFGANSKPKCYKKKCARALEL